MIELDKNELEKVAGGGIIGSVLEGAGKWRGSRWQSRSYIRGGSW